MTTETTTPKKEDYVMKSTPIKGYVQTVGRRKTSTAVVRMSDAKKMSFVINGREGLSQYFSETDLIKKVEEPFTKGKVDRTFAFTVKVSGGGVSSQAEAIRHGIARALIKLDPNLRVTLKKLGHLKRDPRQKERRKFGLKKARKAPQWAKR